ATLEDVQAPTTRGNWITRSTNRWTFFVAPVVAMLLSALVVLIIGHFGSFSIQLTSTPPGAHVIVDGLPAPGITPLLISNLSANRSHEVRVVEDGFRGWRQRIDPVRGSTVFVHAELKPPLPPLPDPAP